MKKGFDSLGIAAHLRLFTCTELMALVAGQQTVDAEEVVAAGGDRLLIVATCLSVCASRAMSKQPKPTPATGLKHRLSRSA